MLIDEIIEKVSELSKIPTNELTEDTELYNSTTISSLSLLELMSFIEKKYMITIQPDELYEENFKDIRTLVEFVTKKCVLVTQ